MEIYADLDKRVSVLEAEMNWSSGTIQEIKKDLESLKNGQNKMLENISTMQTRNELQFIEIHKEIAGIHKEISGLHGEISGFHGEISGLHGEISGLHGEISGIYKAISVQTKWLLTVILAGATIISILSPIMQKVLL